MDTIERFLEKGISKGHSWFCGGQRPLPCKRGRSVSSVIRIAVGIDARNGMVATEGWLEKSDVTYLDLARAMEDAGVKTIIYTDISRDGTLLGVNTEQLGKLNEAVSCDIIASGGVRSIQDILDCKYDRCHTR